MDPQLVSAVPGNADIYGSDILSPGIHDNMSLTDGVAKSSVATATNASLPHDAITTTEASSTDDAGTASEKETSAMGHAPNLANAPSKKPGSSASTPKRQSPFFPGLDKDHIPKRRKREPSSKVKAMPKPSQPSQPQTQAAVSKKPSLKLPAVDEDEDAKLNHLATCLGRLYRITKSEGHPDRLFDLASKMVLRVFKAQRQSVEKPHWQKGLPDKEDKPCRLPRHSSLLHHE